MIYKLFLAAMLTLNPSVEKRQPRQPVAVATSVPIRVTATAYCLTGKMSNGQRTHHGVIALSRDLVKALGLKKSSNQFDCKFGTIIQLKGVGTFIFKDLMPPQWSKRVDVWQPSVAHCNRFGVKRCDLVMLKGGIE